MHYRARLALGKDSARSLDRGPDRPDRVKRSFLWAPLTYGDRSVRPGSTGSQQFIDALKGCSGECRMSLLDIAVIGFMSFIALTAVGLISLLTVYRH